jgi:hypothetical protein
MYAAGHLAEFVDLPVQEGLAQLKENSPGFAFNRGE